MIVSLNRLLVFSILLVGASLACTFNAGGPEPPGPPIPVSEEALLSLESIWQNAEVDPATGAFAFTLNEIQLTSLLAFKLQSQVEPLVHNPQVYLRDGQIILYGTVVREVVTANALVAIMPILDENGRLSLQIVSADFGPIPAPDGVLESISTLLDELLTGSIAQIAASIQLEGLDNTIDSNPSDYIIFDDIQIANGMMTLAGRKR